MVVDFDSYQIPLLKAESEMLRRMGVEIEFAGLAADQTAALIVEVFGGKFTAYSPLHYHVKHTKFGDFAVMLDAEPLQNVFSKSEHIEHYQWDERLLKEAAEAIVPMEISCPPISFSQLNELNALVEQLRLHGAKGTKDNIVYAFGVHLNPELPDNTLETLLRYVRAFIVLEEWLRQYDQVDVARRVTPHIQSYPNAFCLLLADVNWRPDLAEFMAQYVKFNATRNRALDLLPMLAYWDAEALGQKLKLDGVKPRPTLHFRLPNSEVGDAQWSLGKPLQEWMQVEYLANNEALLTEALTAYSEFHDQLGKRIFGDWAQVSQQWLVNPS